MGQAPRPDLPRIYLASTRLLVVFLQVSLHIFITFKYFVYLVTPLFHAFSYFKSSFYVHFTFYIFLVIFKVL